MDANALNRWFYVGYDPGFLTHKAEAVAFVRERLGDFTHWRQRHTPDEWWWEPDYKFIPALQSELYFAAVHEFEAFLALLLAVFQPMPHWLYLTKGYQPGEMPKKAEKLLAGDITGLTSTQCADGRAIVATAVYNRHVSQEEPAKSRWDENLDNAFSLIERMAHYYLEGQDAYNSYKHGIRIVASDIGQFTASGVRQQLAENGVGYLKVGDDGSISEISLEIFPEESICCLSTMYRMQQTIHETRLGDYEPVSQPCINTFLDIPNDELNTWANKQKYETPR
jgi:hypothetical protein